MIELTQQIETKGCTIVELNGIWYMKQGDIYIRLNPQPSLGELRFNGYEWELQMGYPRGHDIPKFNVWGKWK